MRALRTTLAGAVAALALTAAACGGDRDADGLDTAVAPGTVGDAPVAGAPAPGNASALRVTEVWLGRAMRGDTAVVEDIDDFARTDTIHAVVRHEGAAQGVRVTARWTFQDGQVVDERSETVTGVADRPGYAHFMISNPAGWPVGNYKLSVLVDGNEVESEDFEVGG